MFEKVLIANRGAIAVRMERTFARMGVKSVAVYSEADRDSLHVDGADEALCLGGGAPAETYLDSEAIIAAAKQAGAEAIHPGYGFLAENADFARRCAAEGIVFIGPTPANIEEMGLKHVARRRAREAGLSLLPGTELLLRAGEAVLRAREIGYPIILKSTAGGGGIGMRICRNDGELLNEFEGTCHLARENFKNDGVYLEKYIKRARHIEVQVFGTADDEVIVLGERDCSVQRRNQKVVEEAPAPDLPCGVREAMHEAARALAASIGYRNAGTVEFLYDATYHMFYFLEMNSRIQVEHGVTEEVYGVDLIEWMLLEAAGEFEAARVLDLPRPRGHALEARIYAEDCLAGFLPSTGRIDALLFDERARVETWVRPGIEVGSLYDPMLAKLIVHASTREQAMEKMAAVLDTSRVFGVATNRQYLRSLMSLPDYRAGKLSTRILEGFSPREFSLEVLDGGIQTTVQDYPGMVGYWAVGVPPCGPMDSYAFRLANALLDNDEDAAGLEFTVRGGRYRFRCEAAFCLAGADMQACLDGRAVERYRVYAVRSGQVLSLGQAQSGMRGYLCVAGGLDMPRVLGSSSTFIDGRFGGHGGRALRTGDVLHLSETASTRASALRPNPRLPKRWWPQEAGPWTIGVITGPLSTEEFLDASYFDELVSTDFEVNFDSARTGVRLNGPAPRWSRTTGGEAGLHPSNIHDNPYALCALDLTGDQPILLGPDGPSLGGFVCPVVTAISQRWKLGQLRPGDIVRFRILTSDDAARLRRIMESNIATAQSVARLKTASRQRCRATDFAAMQSLDLPRAQVPFAPDEAILYRTGTGDDALCLRTSGEDALLVEYGPMTLDISLRLRVHLLMQALREAASGSGAIIELTPGIRSLQVHFDPACVDKSEIRDLIIAADEALPPLEDVTVPSRIVHLPLSWDDPQTQLAARRYQETTRPDAPWCPSNPEFIRRINGFDSVDEVRRTVLEASYLVLGLGDVYLGAPVATPIDPRHRLVTTKYNPARPWTPENAVGIGGAYLCVYGMEGPGGYQFVGRTTQMWNPLQPTEAFSEGKPWLLDFFDQLRFYEVSAKELMQYRRDCLRGRFNVRIEPSSFNLGDYLRFLKSNEREIAIFKAHQQAAFDAEYQRWVAQGLDTFVSLSPAASLPVEDSMPTGCEPVKSGIAGAVWKVKGEEGARLRGGEELAVLESMKMEFPVCVEADCVVERIFVQPGDLVTQGTTIAAVKVVA
jgi:urea carboxylase